MGFADHCLATRSSERVGNMDAKYVNARAACRRCPGWRLRGCGGPRDRWNRRRRDRRRVLDGRHRGCAEVVKVRPVPLLRGARRVAWLQSDAAAGGLHAQQAVGHDLRESSHGVLEVPTLPHLPSLALPHVQVLAPAVQTSEVVGHDASAPMDVAPFLDIRRLVARHVGDHNTAPVQAQAGHPVLDPAGHWWLPLCQSQWLQRGCGCGSGWATADKLCNRGEGQRRHH
mmetsp:Transcript_86261/g.239201  ORF Transcript_86261/g.239201 Transcript_86261/m.239201 type:complete len:228 (-) Transcript_86261:98-781(-)